ncbi:hypothetical protein RSAG8_08690, partial [Rhizoctonia solani AG-8 WAC10335]
MGRFPWTSPSSNDAQTDHSTSPPLRIPSRVLYTSVSMHTSVLIPPSRAELHGGCVQTPQPPNAHILPCQETSIHLPSGAFLMSGGNILIPKPIILFPFPCARFRRRS